MASVKVAVRVRPFNQREIDMNAKLIIQMHGKTTGILNCKANARDETIRYKEFTFDHSYWSHDGTSEHFSSQEQVYNDLGTEVVDCAFQGYNACVFAYGQTGSGKTFTMMGSPECHGLIPRICKAIFSRMTEDAKRGTTHRVHVSYLEIYQERVADLLRGRDSSAGLRVREHPRKGPYVQGLTTCLVTSYNQIQECMERGNSHRTTAATNMNDVSSRSHAIFTITFVQAGYCDGVPSETVSKIHLVDLAGSERADATGATGQRLKEGAHINKSLVTLGSVISSLAELSIETQHQQQQQSQNHNQQQQQRKTIFIPYRDSVLTWLLKDSLGGNSKTIMIAAVSPADCNYGETLSTLRYANRAKNIINKPTVNEDANVKLIRELRDEISKLKMLMFNEHKSDDMLAQLHEKEAREKELTEEWAEKWREAQEILREQRALGLRKSGPGVVLDSDRPHLVAIDEDPLSTGVTLYHLKEGETTIGTEDSDVTQDIMLRGSGMEPHHCSIILENGVAVLHPSPQAQVMLNNVLIEGPTRLSQGCLIVLGRAHVFRFNDPAEAAQLRKGERAFNLSRLSLLSWSTPDLALSTENLNPTNEDAERDEIESQRLTLVREKESFEREQIALEERKRSLEIAQAKLEAERRDMEREHAMQAKRLEKDWLKLAEQQKQKELELRERETELTHKREELEKERQVVVSQMEQEYAQLDELKTELLIKFKNTCQFVVSHSQQFTFAKPSSATVFQELVSKFETDQLSETDTDILIDLLNEVKGGTLVQELVNQHKRELAALQTELDKRMQELALREDNVKTIDGQIVQLLNTQMSLVGSTSFSEGLENLKESLAKRTEQQIREMEQRKQSLTLNLKYIHGSTDQKSFDLSTDTYHTAASACSTHPLTGEPINNLMSDSGVELQPSRGAQDDSDLSSTDDYKPVSSDSNSAQSVSSVENGTPARKRNRRETIDEVRKLSQLVQQQKMLIVRSLDAHCPKAQLDSQIAVLQDLQRQYMKLKFGSPTTLSPASEHPLQDLSSSSSPSPRRGSTSAINNLPSKKSIQPHLSPYNHIFARSLPSIPNVTSDCGGGDGDGQHHDAQHHLLSVTSYVVRGTGTKTHHEYEVRVATCDERWTVLRRYSRFRELHVAMKAKYGDRVAAIPFPARQLFANTEAVAQARRRQLELYLRRLVQACETHPACPLAYGGPITRSALLHFSPFFRKGVFENGKYGTS